MKNNHDSNTDESGGMEQARAGWDHMQKLIDKVNAGKANEEEIREYNTALDEINKVPRDVVTG